MPEQVPGSGDERERMLELLGHADSSIQRAQLGTVSSGPLQHCIDGVMYLLKYVEALGIQLNELSDAHRQSEQTRAAGDVEIAREFTELAQLIEGAAAQLAVSPAELAERLKAIKTGSGFVDPQGVELAGTVSVAVTIQFTALNFERLTTAAAMAGVEPVELATAAVLRAVDTIVGPIQ